MECSTKAHVKIVLAPRRGLTQHEKAWHNRTRKSMIGSEYDYTKSWAVDLARIGFFFGKNMIRPDTTRPDTTTWQSTLNYVKLGLSTKRQPCPAHGFGSCLDRLFFYLWPDSTRHKTSGLDVDQTHTGPKYVGSAWSTTRPTTIFMHMMTVSIYSMSPSVSEYSTYFCPANFNTHFPYNF